MGISIHSLLTKGDRTGDDWKSKYDISIHSLLTKGDISIATRRKVLCNFNPLPSHEGRRFSQKRRKTVAIISIHSLLTKGDDVISITRGITATFQSTPFSRRETSTTAPKNTPQTFQSTPFSRRETKLYWG